MRHAARDAMPELVTKTIKLTAADEHQLDAYCACPAQPARHAVVVLQEALGVNAHIRSVVREYAMHGYLAIAPALFDRISPQVDVPYSDIPRAIELIRKMDNQQALLDIAAAIGSVSHVGPVGIVGYCWGGTLAYLAAAHLPVSAVASYYGGGLSEYLQHQPKCPMIFHFGEKDPYISLDSVNELKARYPLEQYYLYPAEHGFNCPDRPAYNAASAALSLQRSLAFFQTHLT